MMKVTKRVVGMTAQNLSPQDKPPNLVQLHETRVEDSLASNEDQEFMDDVARDMIRNLSY